jgi:hypothetical protein
MSSHTDIDIDFYDRDSALSLLPHVRASIYKDSKLLPHPSGVYFQNIPTDPLTGLATFDSDESSERGLFKIDFLNASMYEGIENEEHLNLLLSIEPNWDLLSDRSLVEKLPHISEYYDLISKYPVRSVEDLATFLALIRRRHKWYKDKTWTQIKDTIWDSITTEDGYYFKKAHSIAYSVAIGALLVKYEMEMING